MTTIAIDLSSKQVACDSRFTDTYCYIDDRSLCKIKIVNDHLFALTGTSSFLDPLINEWVKNCSFEIESFTRIVKPEYGNFNFIVISNDLKVRLYYSHLSPYPNTLSDIEAFGSGRCFALGAMKTKRCVKNAVKVASELDTFTGGHIPLFKHNIKKGWHCSV